MNLSDVSTVLGLITALVACLAWIFRLESRVSVLKKELDLTNENLQKELKLTKEHLQMELNITKEYQKQTNDKLDKRLTDIQQSIENLTRLFVK